MDNLACGFVARHTCTASTQCTLFFIVPSPGFLLRRLLACYSINSRCSRTPRLPGVTIAPSLSTFHLLLANVFVPLSARVSVSPLSQPNKKKRLLTAVQKMNNNNTPCQQQRTSNFFPRRIPPNPTGSQKSARRNFTTVLPMSPGDRPAAKSPATRPPALAPAAKLTCNNIKTRPSVIHYGAIRGSQTIIHIFRVCVFKLLEHNFVTNHTGRRFESTKHQDCEVYTHEIQSHKQSTVTKKKKTEGRHRMVRAMLCRGCVIMYDNYESANAEGRVG